MRYRSEQSFLGVIGVTAIILAALFLKLLTSPIGKLLIGCAVIFCIIYVIIRLFYMDALYEKFSTKLVNKKFVINNTALRNNNCTINLTSGQKIVVMENNFGTDNTKKMFTVSSNDTKINKSWYKICTIFDEFSSLASLAAFFNLEMINVNIITYDTKKNSPVTVTKDEPKNPKQSPHNEGRIIDL